MEPVRIPVCPALAGERLFPEEKRGDVIAAAEEKALAQPGEGWVTGLLAAGDHKRDPAGSFHARI